MDTVYLVLDRFINQLTWFLELGISHRWVIYGDWAYGGLYAWLVSPGGIFYRSAAGGTLILCVQFPCFAVHVSHRLRMFLDCILAYFSLVAFVVWLARSRVSWLPTLLLNAFFFTVLLRHIPIFACLKMGWGCGPPLTFDGESALFPLHCHSNFRTQTYDNGGIYI